MSERTTQATELFDCSIDLTTSRLDASQLREFADAQMPRSGIGEVPWSTPLSIEQLVRLAETGKAEFITARVQLMADGIGQLPLAGIGALIRDPDNYPHPRMIVVVDNDARGQGLGGRIVSELLERVQFGETVQVEIQQAPTSISRAQKFFEGFGFECSERNHRTGNVPEYIGGQLVGSVERNFALYSLTKNSEGGSLPGGFRGK